jgi:hypothetical protein
MNFDFSTPLTIGDIRVVPLSPDVAELRLPPGATLRNEGTMTSQTADRMYLARGQRYSIDQSGKTVAFFDVGPDGWTIFS